MEKNRFEGHTFDKVIKKTEWESVFHAIEDNRDLFSKNDEQDLIHALTNALGNGVINESAWKMAIVRIAYCAR